MIKFQKETFDEKQQLLTFAKSGRCRVALYIGEETAIEATPAEDGGETKERTVYAYNVGWLEADGKITSESEALAALKAMKTADIDRHDTSPAVNSFTMDGIEMWLPKDTRVGLMNSLSIEKKAGKESSTLWFGSESFELSINYAMTMLSKLELYALECYNVTASHKADVAELTSVEEVVAYDYESGYPDKLNF